MKKFKMKKVIIEGYEFEIEENKKIIGLITESQEDFGVHLKPGNKFYDYLKKLK